MHDGVAGFQNGDRAADGGRIDGKDRARKGAQHFGVVGIALGRGGDARAPVGRHPLRLERGRQVVFGDRRGIQLGAQLREIGLKRHDERRLHLAAHVNGCLRELDAVGGEAPRRIGAGALGVVGEFVQLLGQPVERGDILRVGRRLRRLLVEDRLDVLGKLLDHRQLLVLILRHQALQRRRVLDLRQLFEPRGGGDRVARATAARR